MNLLDFSDRKNKFIPLADVSPEYIKGLKQFVEKSSYYPAYHIAPPHGLMNDPNGLCQIDGWYHIFYQWFPLGPVHGLKHWYHLKTRDFIHYKDFGPAIIPDSDLDRDGCFTGAANEENGQWFFYYTGVKDGIQQVVKARFDGDKTISDKTLVIPHDPNLTTNEFRDPVIYKNRYILVGSQKLDKKGSICVFKKCGNSFENLGFMSLHEDLAGYMIECPNLISLDEKKDLLIFSPMGVGSPDRFTFRNVFSVAYGIGHFDSKNVNFDTDLYSEMDNGFDFYAPQIFRDETDRVILLGWFGNSKCVYPSDAEQWAHMMTLPRSISYEGNKLCQKPLEELKGLRKEAQPLEKDQKLINGSFELDLDPLTDFSITLYNEAGEYLTFSGKEKEYCLDRAHSSHLYNEKYGQKRYGIRDLSKSQRLRIFVDRSAIEIFADNGFCVFTSRFYLDRLSGLKCQGAKGNLYYLRNLETEEIR